jgi:uncharacterized protein with von Willebrand factor type A (vWA) domain
VTDDPALLPNIMLFGRVLRRSGVELHHSRLLDSLRALEFIGISRREDVRATLQALLVHRHEDLARFNAAFDVFFRARGGAPSSVPLFSLGERPRVVVRPLSAAAVDVELEDVTAGGSSAPTRVIGAYSATAVSRTRDFAEFTPAELELARRVLERLPWRLGQRRTRRWVRRDEGTAVDLRPTLRRSLTRGDLIELTFRRRRTAPRPVVVIGDVSGSMERYSRILLHFVYGLARSVRHVESFVFSTTLTRISRRLSERGAAEGLTRTIREVKDWGGGTRIGEALRLFNAHWARRVMRHGPVVLIVSDGWDRGDPDMLAREIARLRRNCRRLIWLNPLLGSADYAPLTRGMQAALPFVDDFLPAHNLASLEQLAGHLQALA